MCTVSRQEYDGWKVRELEESARMVDAVCDAQELHDGAYPKSTSEAIVELNERGLSATDWSIERFARFPDLVPPVMGRARLWTKEDIDKLADYMREIGVLTNEARWRREHGLSWAEEQALLEKHRESKKGDQA